ncbi:hypothetical protein [Kribbella sp. NPDC051620]|uniref:hypothetical protein n=1 Tax=Kribbella sp. NPDC051620 TaxID=3364120 RepID=UPI0037A59D3A
MNDDELLAKLKAADPARHAPEPNPDRLLEATMTTDTETRPDTTSTTRRRWLPAVAAGVLLVGGGIAWGIAGNSGDDNQPIAGAPTATVSTPGAPTATAGTPGSTPTATAGTPAVLKLTVGAAPNAKCRAVEVADLRRMETAFAGTATAIKGEQVTLHVDHWYRGGDATTVQVQSDADAVTTLLGVDFKVGGTYLITANDAQVTLCGESAPTNPELLALYKTAFGG